MQTSLQSGHHENHLIWVDSSLMVPWLSFETLGLQSKGPASPDHFENLLTRVDLIKVTHVPWAPVGPPLIPGYCHFCSLRLQWRIRPFYMCTLQCAILCFIYNTFIVYILFNSFILFHSAEILFCLNSHSLSIIVNYYAFFWSWKCIPVILIPEQVTVPAPSSTQVLYLIPT
jgi:hypothetical protein